MRYQTETKQLKNIIDIYYLNLFPSRNENRKLEDRLTQLTGKCTTRKATKEELDKYSNNIKTIDNYEELLYNIIYGETLPQTT